MALADAVIRTALEVAEDRGLRRVTRLGVRVGELQRIDREAFRFCLDELRAASEPTLLAGAEIAVATEPARFACRGCELQFGLADTRGADEEREAEAIHFIPELAHAFLDCPRCHSPDFDVTEGRGVSIDALEGT
jgi:hydrogenase nickel incorporation protein HypA/HybF